MNSLCRFSRVTSVVLTALLFNNAVFAGDSTWTGSSVDSLWASPENWAGTGVAGDTSVITGATTGNTDIATFNHNLNLQITVDPYRNLRSLVFNPGVDAFVLQTGTLAFSNAGSVVINGGVTRPQTISSPVLFVPAAVSEVFTSNSTNNDASLIFNGSITGQRPAAAVTGLILNGVGDGWIDAPVGNGSGGGKVSIAKGGAGTWTLSRGSSFTGGITANNGNLVLDHTSQFPIADPLNAINLGGGNLIIKARDTGTTALTLGDLALTAGKGLSTLSIDKNGGVGTTLTLGNNWTRNSGAMFLLDLSSGGSVISSPALTNSVITGVTTGTSTPAGFLIKDDSGKVDFAGRDVTNRIVRLDTISGAVTAYTTGTPVAVGTKNYKISADATLTTGTNAFGTLRIDSSANPVTISMGSNSIVPGKAVVVIDGSNDVNLVSDSGTGGGKIGSSGLIIGNFGTGVSTISARIGISSGTTAASFTGPGVTVLNFDNSTQEGATTIQGGLLRLAKTNALPTGNLTIQNGGILELAAADFTRGSGITAGLLQFNSGSGGFSAFGAPRLVNIGGSATPATLTWGSFIADGSTLILGSRTSDNTLTFANSINLNDGNRLIQVNNGVKTDDVDAVVSGVISSTNTTAGLLTKTGPGTLVLTGTNTYSGGTNILAGQLNIGNGGSTGALSNIGLIDNEATLVFNRSNSYLYTGAITGSGQVKQIGSGKTTFAGLNTYTGSTTISAGTLAGTGSAASDLNVQAGTLEPGVTVGTYFTASATLSSAARTIVQIDGDSADKIQASGAITLGGALAISPVGSGVTHPPYVIAEGASLSGSFSSVTAGFKVTYTLTQAILSIAPTYADWAAAWAPGQTELGDHDGDGVANGVEYFMGETGSSPTTLPGPVSASGGMSVAWPKGITYYGFYGLDHVVQTSTNLQPEGQPGGWQDVPANQVVDSASSLSYTLPAGSPKWFVRLKVIVREVPSIVPVPPTKIPPTPLGLAMTANTASSITLSWYSSPVNDNAASIYHIYASTSATGTFTEVGTSTARTFTHSALPSDAKRFYKVSAANVVGESAASTVFSGSFTIIPSDGSPLPVLIAKNMCLTLGATIVSNVAPTIGTLSKLVDGLDSTVCGIPSACEVRMKLNTNLPVTDASYLMLNFRSDQTGQAYPYNIVYRALKTYTITESFDSTNGVDGTWTDIVTDTNGYLDGVIVIPNHQPKWIGVKNSGSLQLSRLDIFRAAPAGYRNDYWIFAGDSLVVQDLVGGGAANAHSVWFSDLVRQRHADRYPIVVNSSQGGEIMTNTSGRLKNQLPIACAPNGTAIPTGTFLCFEPGFNDVGVGGGLYMGPQIIQNLTDTQTLCNNYGMFLVPVRIEYSSHYLNLDTLEPTTYNIFYNTLAVNLAGVDVYTRKFAPYACDPATQLPYADYWTYTRQNYATAIGSDGVHHTKAGSDGINTLWADVADKMIYLKQP